MSETLIHAEVSLETIAQNTRFFVNHVGPHVKVMPAVKANAYGHGAVQVSKIAIENGASALGVSRVHEGIELRNAGIDVPILVFGYAGPEAVNDVIEGDLTVTVSHIDVARALSTNALKLGKKLSAHLKVDTGMGRIGIMTEMGHPGCRGVYENALEDTLAMAALPGLSFEGIYTHFANADRMDKNDAKAQLRIFNDFIQRLESKGLTFPIKHAANSAAALELPESHFDMVRPGISFYGLSPSNEIAFEKTGLKPAMALKSKIVDVKRVCEGFRISYGSTHVVDKDSVIAVVPVGYADGFNRHFSSNGSMLVHGQKAPIVGRVCMDLTMIDVSHIPDVSIEDEVVIFGSQGHSILSVDELADRLGTINYEIVSNVNARVKRVYV